MTDVAICVFYVTADDRVECSIHIVDDNVRAAVLSRTAQCTRRLIDSYALLCTRAAMVMRHALLEHVQRPLDARRAREISWTGVSTVRMHRVVGVDVTATQAYIVAAREFFLT